MATNRKSFECIWCKEAGCTPEEYTRDVSELGSVTAEGDTICQECHDAAVETLADN